MCCAYLLTSMFGNESTDNSDQIVHVCCFKLTVSDDIFVNEAVTFKE